MASSGIQIPGLGFAKPNETLPPLPPTTGPAASRVEAGDVTPGEKDTEVDPNSNGESATEPRGDVAMQDAPSVSNDDQTDPPIYDALLAHLQPANPTNIEQETGGDGGGEQGGEAEWEVDSSPIESSSDSSTDSSDDDESENEEGYELLGVEETARLLMEVEGGSDDEGDNRAGQTNGSQLRTKNEIVEEMIPKPDITITPDMKIEELGVVESVIGTTILIKAFTPGEYQVLDTGSVLCLANRTVVAAVAETMGKVVQPLYTAQFATPEELANHGIAVGTKIYYPTQHATFVFTQPLKNVKGSDASNLHDEEVGDDEMEFSDDEKEAEYKRQLKNKKQAAKAKNRERAGKEPHPLRTETSAAASGGLNYDDDEDGPYRPLARPVGYGQGPPPPEEILPGAGGHTRGHQRGGRRGDFQGRGRGRWEGGRGSGRGKGGRDGRRDSRDSGPREGYSLPPQRPPSEQGQNVWTGAGTHQPSPAGGSSQQSPVSATGSFNFPFIPGWTPPASSGQPAAPPAWPGFPPAAPPAQQHQQHQQQPGVAFNPMLFQQIMQHVQQAQAQAQAQTQAQNGQQGQWPPQPPPGGNGGRQW